MSKKNNNLAWERLSQVEKMMQDNKPVKVKEQAPKIGWEKCVQEHFKKQKAEWDRRKKS